MAEDFGGYKISFSGCLDRLEDVFGDTPIAPATMTKKLWEYVKAHGLGRNKEGLSV